MLLVYIDKYLNRTQRVLVIIRICHCKKSSRRRELKMGAYLTAVCTSVALFFEYPQDFCFRVGLGNADITHDLLICETIRSGSSSRD